MTQLHPDHIPDLVALACGNRQVGKDTLFSLFRQFAPQFRQFSFAARLKRDVAPLIRDHFGYDPDNLTPEQKEIVRHLYIGYGMAQRARDPDHWVKTCIQDIGDTCASSTTPVWVFQSDGRFVNELARYREAFGDRLVIVNITREGAPPPTDEEEKHYRQVAAMADIHFHWGNDTENERREKARTLLADVIRLSESRLAAAYGHAA